MNAHAISTKHLDAISMLVDGVRHERRRPLIGVSAGTTTLAEGPWAGHEAHVLTRAYTRAIAEAGARAVILTIDEPWTREEILDLDALVITGGSDLDPELYGQVPAPTDYAPHRERDAYEIALVNAAWQARIPVLGICRGLQIINVARGGSLIQHVADREDLRSYPDTNACLTEVDVHVEADSDLALALGTHIRVRAFHHQAVDRLGQGLRVVARHDSSLIHAVESSGENFVLGVQFHPEVSKAQPLFDGFIEAARCRHSNRARLEQ